MISKIHDYYDGIARNTISDKSFTFVRDTRDIDGHHIYINDTVYFTTKTQEICVEYMLMGFCGEIYPFVQIDKRHIDPNGIDFEPYCFYDWDKFKNEMPIDQMVNKHLSAKYFTDGSDYNINNIKQWLTTGVTGRSRGDVHDINYDNKLMGMFDEYKVAYFVFKRKGISSAPNVTLYPILKDYDFYKVFDTYTCYQTIENYLTNELVKPDEIKFQPSDELKVQSHGFDKFSFRKDPSNKR
jgi:hypothetical protein